MVNRNVTVMLSALILVLVVANVKATSLSIASITPSNAHIDNGQSITITGTWSGGIAPYNAVWYTGPYGTTCPQEAANVLAVYNGLSTTSNSITVSPTTSNSYCLGITDSESPQVTRLSLNYTENSITFDFDFLNGVAFSPSGTYAYVTMYPASDNVVIINTATNTVVNSITSHISGPQGVAFSPSGTYAYITNCNSSCGFSGTDNVMIINTATNTVVNSITSGFSYPEGVAFSPSGTYAYVTNEESNNVVVINTATNTVVNSILSGFSTPSGVAFSPSNTYAYVTNFRNNNVVIINTATNTVVNSITSGINDPQGVSFSPSGTYAYVTDQTGNLSVINTATNTVTGSITSGFNFPTGVSFSPSGTYAYVVNSNDNNVVIINPGIGSEITNLIYSSIVVNPALSANAITPSNPVVDGGKSVILNANPSGGTTPYKYQWYSGTSSTCSSDTLISGATSQTYDASPTSSTYYCYKVTDSATTPETVASATTEVVINPVLSTPTITPSNPTIDSGQSVSFTASWSGGTPTYGASLYSSTTPTCNYESNLIQQDIGIQSNSVTFSPVTTNSNTYYCVSVTDNAIDSYYISNSIESGFVPEGIAFSPSGTYAYISNFYGPNFSLNGNITVINLATNSISKRITYGFYFPTGVSFSPSGTYAYVTNLGNNVVIINTASNTVVNAITSGFSDPEGVAISPSGTYAYVTNCNSSCSGSGPDNVVIINTATNTVVNSITSGFNEPEGVAFSPSGTYAYVANPGSNTVVIINTASNTVTGSITSGFNFPTAVSFSPSGTYAYVANEDSNNVVIINTASNTVTGSITSGFAFPEGVAISPSDKYAYVANEGSSNVLIINTGTSTTNSIYSLVSVNPTLSVPTISPSNKIINSGQSVTFSSTWSGGTPDYIAKLYSSSTSTCNTGSTLIQSIPSLTTGSTAFNPVTPASTTYYCIFITDSASTPVTVNSINSEVTLTSSGPQISNPYAGGPTGYFGPGPTPTIPTSTTSTISSSTTSTILPVITITQTTSAGTTKICNDTSGYTINYSLLNATIKIAPEIGCFRINVTNSTLQSKALNKSVITALNYTVNNTNVSADMILHYSCSIPNSDVAPFILRNGTWQEITPFTLNVAACTVEFAIPSDPVIALLNTNITSTITTTSATTTAQVPVTTVPAPQQNDSTILILVLIVIVIIVIAALFIYMRDRR